LITYDRFTLENGLRVVVHEDRSSPLVAVNVLYDVGSRDENPNQTGFAHLFEHLMFGGSVNIKDFDEPIQSAGGENNAFTNSDITNFYDIVPRENIEIPFWLESDRMLSLAFSKKALDTQRKVVVEEFKETTLNEPYGDVWHHISEMVYTQHPYRWPTIGLVPEHIEDAKLSDVKAFFKKYYCPSNAILTVTGNTNLEEVRALSEKWFAPIPAGDSPVRALTQEPEQTEMRRRELVAAVPLDALYMCFTMQARADDGFYVADLLSDILASGRSCRLYQRLVKELRIFSSIDAYVTGTIDPGLFVVEGKPNTGITLEAAEAAVWQELEALQQAELSVKELQKIKNQMQSAMEFSEGGVLNKANNLAFYELLGNVDLINTEADIYERITAKDLQATAQILYRKENCSVLYYRAKAEA
jgi:zinc protease